MWQPERSDMSMTAVTGLVGAVLAVLGLVGYFASGRASLTALIPTAVGVLLLVCAYLARREAWHRHAIHAALVIALVGAAGSLMNVVKIADLFTGTAERPLAIVVSTIMFVLLVAYLVLGIRSFVRARRQRSVDQTKS
jgi:uncharacterized membrane protein